MPFPFTFDFIFDDYTGIDFHMELDIQQQYILEPDIRQQYELEIRIEE